MIKNILIFFILQCVLNINIYSTEINNLDFIEFNSKKATRDLFKKTLLYIKYNSLENNNTNKIYYNVLSYEPPTKIKIMAINKKINLNKNNYDGVIAYKNDIILEDITVSGVFIFYDSHYQQKVKLEFDENHFVIDNWYLHQISCSKFTKSCTLSVYKKDFDLNTRDMIKDIPKFQEDIFNKYYQKYDGQSIFKDKNNKLVKYIDYKAKKISYFYYKNNKKYVATCNVLTWQCEMKFPEF